MFGIALFAAAFEGKRKLPVGWRYTTGFCNRMVCELLVEHTDGRSFTAVGVGRADALATARTAIDQGDQ